MIIVDNSVLVAFVFPQDDFHAAAMAARSKDADWHAPALIRSESRNVARAYPRRGTGARRVCRRPRAGPR